MTETETKKRGRPPGQTKAAGHAVSSGRPRAVQDVATAALLLRFKLLQARAPHGTAPARRELATATGCSMPTFERRLRGEGRFTAAQLAAGNAYCDERSPPGFAA